MPPVPNDLSPEEEREFAQHGVQPAGEGREPIVESDADIQQREEVDQHGDRRPAEQQPEISRHREDGTFKSQEELDAERAALAEQQGQQRDEDEEGGEQKMVPLPALHAERQRAAQLARRAQLAEARMNAMIERGFGETPQAELKMPSLEENPAEYIIALEKRLEAFEQARTQDLETRRVDEALTADEDLFKTTMPDYDRASNYYVQSRARELLQFHTPQDAQRIMVQEARTVARQAWARGQSAGEVIYNLAMARGYNPNLRQREPEDQGQQQQGQQGRPTAQDVVRGMRKGQQASRSLGGGGGRAATETLNAEALLNMSDDEFEDYLALGTRGANERFAAIG